MRQIRTLLRAVVLMAGFLALRGPAAKAPAQTMSDARFRVTYPASAHDGPITGRVFVMISTTDEREPRLQIGRSGVPFFGRDVEDLEPGQFGIIDATDIGSPLESLSELPAGDYFVQGMVNVYTEFR
ncbi:MAG: hypothetical protein PVJ76_19155, partial [Gemmatimonadota bacterium]